MPALRRPGLPGQDLPTDRRATRRRQDQPRPALHRNAQHRLPVAWLRVQYRDRLPSGRSERAARAGSCRRARQPYLSAGAGRLLMKAAEFDYARPETVEEVCRLLDRAAGDGKIIAGGQTLVPLLVMRLTRPTLVIDIN